MANDIQAFIDRVRAAKAGLIANRRAQCLGIALDQIALMKLRVQGTGVQDNNLPLAPYTPAYSKQRKRAGYQVAYVDYTRTGQFMASITPAVTSESVFQCTIEIAPNNDRGRTILAGAVKRNGRLLTASSAAEIALARKANQKRVLDYFRNI